MKVVFWSADELRKEFDVIASFYQLKLGNKVYTCRNHAIIIRKGFANQSHPDSLVIMANPGSCNPKDQSYEPPFIQSHFSNVPFVLVEDDPTIRQLMRLMKIMNWNVLAIRNLSDLCSGNMDDFGELLSQVEHQLYMHHSIFSKKRKVEREKCLIDTHPKIILAWGKDPCLNKLACAALNTFPKDQPIFGLRYLTPDWGFRHPNPLVKERCVKWLEEMSQQITLFDS